VRGRLGSCNWSWFCFLNRWSDCCRLRRSLGNGNLRRTRSGYSGGFRRLILAQKSAGNAQRTFRLLDVNRLGKNQVGADAERLGYSSLSLDHCDGQGRLVVRSVARALEEQCGVLLIVAINHNRVEMRGHHLLHGGEWLSAGNYFEVELAQNLRNRAGGLFVGTEE